MLPKLNAMLEAQVVKPGPITVVHGEIHMQGYLLKNGHFCTTMCCAALDRGKCTECKSFKSPHGYALHMIQTIDSSVTKLSSGYDRILYNGETLGCIRRRMLANQRLKENAIKTRLKIPAHKRKLALQNDTQLSPLNSADTLSMAPYVGAANGNVPKKKQKKLKKPKTKLAPHVGAANSDVPKKKQKKLKNPKNDIDFGPFVQDIAMVHSNKDASFVAPSTLELVVLTRSEEAMLTAFLS